MGLAMIAIIIFHHGFTVIPGITAFFSRFGLWGVDVFLFLSGFGCVYALKKYATTTFYKKRLVRLLPACLVAGIVVVLINLHFGAERTEAPLWCRALSLHRWYIQAILICYVICPWAYIVIRRYKVFGLILLIIACLLASLFVPSVGFLKFSWIVGRIPVFLIGIYVAEYDLTMSWWQCIVSMLCLAAAVVLRLKGGIGIIQWPYLLAPAIPLVCMALCRLKTIADKMNVSSVIEVFGACSLEIYLIHEYLYWALYKTEFPLGCKYMLFLLLVTVLCAVVRKVSVCMIERFNS